MTTPESLGYSLYKNNDDKIIYVKYESDRRVTLELDIQNKTVQKYVNDFIKKVEVKPSGIESILMKNLL